MDGRNSGERPTEEQSKMSVNSKSDSNETPSSKPPHTHCQTEPISPATDQYIIHNTAVDLKLRFV